MLEKDYLGEMKRIDSGGEDNGRTRSWKVVLEEFFHSSCILKYLLPIRDTKKNRLFLSYKSWTSVGSMLECKGQGNEEAMRHPNKGEHPS